MAAMLLFKRRQVAVPAALWLALVGVNAAHAQEAGTTAVWVKVNVVARKIEPDGKQALNVVLDIDDKCYVFANPVGTPELEAVQMVARVFRGGKAVETSVGYPPSQTQQDKLIGDFNVYKGQVLIRVVVDRRPDESQPIEVVIRMQAQGTRLP